MKKVGFNNHVILFFTNYLVDRKTNYFWNNLISLIFNVNVGVGQSSALSPILSALYLSPFIYILENHLKNLKIPVSIISFISNGLFISQSNSFDILNSCSYCSYDILTNLLEKFSLVVEHSKTEIFHFNRSHGIFNPPPLNLSPLGGNILWLNDSWKYLGFIFNRKLTFHQHVNFYAKKSISTVKYMKILGNSNCGINSLQKCLLYRTCILPIAFYGFQLWFYNCAPTAYCYGMFWTEIIFIFLFFLFSDFIRILFSFSFLLNDEEACDTAVTWHITWCDVIGLKGGGRI